MLFHNVHIFNDPTATFLHARGALSQGEGRAGAVLVTLHGPHRFPLSGRDKDAIAVDYCACQKQILFASNWTKPEVSPVTFRPMPDDYRIEELRSDSREMLLRDFRKSLAWLEVIASLPKPETRGGHKD